MFAQTNYVTVNAPLDSGITFDPIKSPFGNFITTLIRGAQAIYCKQPAIQVNSYVFKKLGVLLFVVCYLQLHHAFCPVYTMLVSYYVRAPECAY
jgi:hypothetical protein